MRVDPSVTFQKWDGWGTSLCWWAYVVGSYPDDVRKDICQKAFRELGINVVRYNIGGGDDPAHHHLQPRAAVPGYLRRDGTYNWSADAGQRWVLHEAKRLGANHFEAFSNSPPYWMTRSGCASGNHDGSDNFDDFYRGRFADYLAAVAAHFRDRESIEFDTLDPLNEPAANWWRYGGHQEGCCIPPGAPQSALIAALGASLASKGLKTRVSASDESINDWAVSSWNALTPEAKQYVAQINTHCYGGNAQAKLHELAVRDKKRLWMSEYGDNDGSGMKMAQQIVKDLRVMRPSVWAYWQVVDQPGSGWGLLESNLNRGQHEYTVNKKFYVFGNFSEFIRPGSQFISIGDENSVASLNKLMLTIVSVNSGDAKKASYDLSAFGFKTWVVTPHQTSPTDNLTEKPPLTISNGHFSADLPANSVTTFVLRVGRS